MAEPLQAPAPVWSTPVPGAPAPGWDDRGLFLEVRPAVTPAGLPTAAALVAYAVDARLNAVYGARLRAAIQVVAVDARTGEARARAAALPDEVPVVATMRPDASPGADDPDAVASGFNVDLMAHLALRPVRREHDVFLWLDELVSPLRRVEVPGPDPRDDPRDDPLEGPASLEEPDLRVQPVGAAPPDGVTLALRPGPDPGATAGAALEGTFAVAGAAWLPLTVLALSQRTRRVVTRAALLPEPIARAGRGALRLDLGAFLPFPGPDRVFLLALVGGVRSDVARLDLR